MALSGPKKSRNLIYNLPEGDFIIHKQNQIRRCTHSFTVTSTSKGQARWCGVCLRSHGLSLPCQYTFIVSVVRRTRRASLSVHPPTPSQLTIRIDECLVQRDLEFIHLLSEHSTFYHFQIQTHVSCHSTVMSPRTSNEILLSNVSTVSTGSFCSPKPPITSTCTQYFGELQGVRSVLS